MASILVFLFGETTLSHILLRFSPWEISTTAPPPVWDFDIFVPPRTLEGWRRMGCRGRYKIRSFRGGSECTWRPGLLRSSRFWFSRLLADTAKTGSIRVLFMPWVHRKSLWTCVTGEVGASSGFCVYSLATILEGVS